MGALAQKERNEKAEADAWYAVTNARLACESADMMDAATKTHAMFKDLGNKTMEAAALQLVAQGHLANNDPQAALRSAKESLAIAKDIGDGEKAAQATAVLVEACIAADTPQDGLEFAEKELKAIQDGKQKGIVIAMNAVILGVTATSGPDDGLVRVKKFVEQLRNSGDERGEAAMLHKLACMSAVPEEAMNAANVALGLARKIGDAKEEKAIKRSLTDLYVARGKVDKAPNRKEALTLLAELAKDLEAKNGEKFDDAMKRMNGFWSALTENDFSKVLSKVIQKDPQAYNKFLQDHGVDTGMNQEKTDRVEGSVSARPVPMPMLYIGFRFGGLGYGPRFRCCSAMKKMNTLEKEIALGVVQLQDCSDDWERELGYNSSMMDCALHTAASAGHQV